MIGNLIINDIFVFIFCSIQKMYCQESAKELELEDEAECYKMLKEYAGDIIPSLALCLPDHVAVSQFI